MSTGEAHRMFRVKPGMCRNQTDDIVRNKPATCVDAHMEVINFTYFQNGVTGYTYQHASWNPGLNPTMYTPIAHDYCVAQR